MKKRILFFALAFFPVLALAQDYVLCDGTNMILSCTNEVVIVVSNHVAMVISNAHHTFNPGGDDWDTIIEGTNGALLTVDAADETVTMNKGLTVDDSVSIGAGLQVLSGEAILQRQHTVTNSTLNIVRVKAITSGDMVDGFGAAVRFDLGDPAATNRLGQIRVQRAGSDTEGSMSFMCGSSGNEVLLHIEPDAAPVTFTSTGIVATAFIEYSDEYTGDAVTALKAIRTSEGIGNYKPTIHSTLPPGVGYSRILDKTWQEKEVIADKDGIATTNFFTVTNSVLQIEGAEIEDLGNNKIKVWQKNLGAMISVNTRALIQLIEDREAQQAEIADLKKRLEALEP